MIRLLVSAQDAGEALQAAQAGADFVDLKDPSAGALGGLPVAQIAAIVAALKGPPGGPQLSATIGDFDVQRRPEIVERVAAVAACGVDLVKVGIVPGERRLVSALLQALADCGAQVVPVFIADDGVDQEGVAQALALRAFPALMLDTAAKREGSLLQRLPAEVLRGFVRAVQAGGVWAGLAGALREADLPALAALAPDFAGFRSAVCTGGRAGALDPAKVARLAAALSDRALLEL